MRRAPLPILAFVLLAFVGAAAQAQNVDRLRAKVERAQAEAGQLAGSIRATRERQLAVEAEADEARRRERRVASLLAGGERRAARLRAQVARTERRLAAEKRRLRRARVALARRLVAIYTSGSPSTASVVLASSDFDELAVRTEYLRRIERSDAELAARVEGVRDAVRADLERIDELKRRVEAHNERLARARAKIGAVRARAEAAAAELADLGAQRAAELARLKSSIGRWVSEVEAAETASREAAERTVGRWLGGPYSIPTYIVMCESGGNYSALNPSSGAGGAYQIIPSTWDAYGGKGAPHEAPKAEQDRIAAAIWADSGGSAWVCAG